jgi:hypothetical protein
VVDVGRTARDALRAACQIGARMAAIGSSTSEACRCRASFSRTARWALLIKGAGRPRTRRLAAMIQESSCSICSLEIRDILGR